MTLSTKIKLKIQQVRLNTKRLVGSSGLGARSVNQSGVGFEFDQLREYQQSDDIRFVDWKSSARAGKMMTKQFFDERNQLVTIALDISGSSFTGTLGRSKFAWMAELAAIFTLVAQSNRDQVGLVLFSDQIDLHLTARAGAGHTQHILEQIFSQVDTGVKSAGQTNLKQVLARLGKVLPKKNLILLISDFIDQSDFYYELRLLNQRHDVVAVRWLDKFEHELPLVGLLPVCDPESGESGLLDLREIDKVDQILTGRISLQDKRLRSCGVDLLRVSDLQQAIGEIIRFFQKRVVAR